MRAVDTNVLIRLVTRDDARQAAAADRFVARGCWVSHVVLAETAWVLADAYEFSHAKIAAAIEMFVNHEQVTLENRDVVEAALSKYRGAPALGFSDCLILEIARKAGHLPLGTFDRALAKRDGAERV
jgi:predicted nucleic-acid-binding protein